jgi:hypothetical protein
VRTALADGDLLDTVGQRTSTQQVMPALSEA